MPGGNRVLSRIIQDKELEPQRHSAAEPPINHRDTEDTEKTAEGGEISLPPGEISPPSLTTGSHRDYAALSPLRLGRGPSLALPKNLRRKRRIGAISSTENTEKSGIG